MDRYNSLGVTVKDGGLQFIFAHWEDSEGAA